MSVYGTIPSLQTICIFINCLSRTQVNIRIRKLAKEEERLGERTVPRLANKVRRREDTRERKALAAAKVERAIERVLIDRLRSGAYGDKPLNVEPNVWKRVMAGLEKEGQATRDEDLDDDEDEEENEAEFEHEGEGREVEYVSDMDGESDDDLEDFEDWVGGHSPDEDEEEDEGEEDGDDDEGSDSASEDDEEEDELAALQKKLASLKRKRPNGRSAKPKKKPSKGVRGPRVEIEIEREPTARERQLVRN